MQGAKKIYAFDVNKAKFEHAISFGATDCHNPMEVPADQYLLEREKWGADYTYDCTGNVNVMRQAFELAHRGTGQSCIIGVAAAGKEISTRPF